MQVTITPRRGKQRIELVDAPNPDAAANLALWRVYGGSRGRHGCIEVSPEATYYALQGGGVVEVRA